MHKLKILCTGDLHLGRTSSKCVHDGEEAAGYSARDTWARVIEYAIAQQVDLVLLSGDIADDGSNQYEAMGPFEAGLPGWPPKGYMSIWWPATMMRACCRAWRVSSAGKQCIYWDAAALGTVRVAAGERTPGALAGRLVLPHAACAPLAPRGIHDSPPSRRPGDRAGAYGLPRKRLEYAGVTLAALQACPASALWLLGHIHAPEQIDGAPIILNPGSPQALDPGEPGVHGPWLVKIAGGRITQVEQIPLSSVATLP